MQNEVQGDLLSDADTLNLAQMLLADLHDDLPNKIARLRQLADLSSTLGPGGTMMPGGEMAYNAWVEARSSFVQGNYIATVLLCQSLAEHLLAAHISLGLDADRLPKRITFRETVRRCIALSVFDEAFSIELLDMMEMRHPLSHFRDLDDPSNLSRRVLDTRIPANEHLRRDASSALATAIRLLSLPPFWLSGETLE